MSSRKSLGSYEKTQTTSNYVTCPDVTINWNKLQQCIIPINGTSLITGIGFGGLLVMLQGPECSGGVAEAFILQIIIESTHIVICNDIK
ncbi:hypothetical protein GDO81_024546 [Engystomops pustulosus]|uniref:Uncharacterized protein n=1 Tax=Engystomops pustulosus TaxID=76066 RepID=A0AAV6YR24_ENGPU|nr:hypothetical protein GDO81_024546 [Engystomops pustulosus]